MLAASVAGVARPSHAAVQFASRTTLVEVYATVTGPRGQLLTDLPREAFRVTEDGVARPVEVFAAGDVPLSLAIAVDHSFSVPRDRLDYAVNAAQRLLGLLQPTDAVTVLGIGSGVEVLSPLGNDHRAAFDALARVTPWGTTPLFDATVAAIDAVQDAPGRRALILVSDGTDRFSAASAADMLAAARRRDVQVYPVLLGRTVPDAMREVAAVTGGRAQAVPDVRALAGVLAAIAAELRAQYLLGYAPAAEGAAGWRTIGVQVTTPGATVRARAGYLAPAAPERPGSSGTVRP
jgi:VWFA-related protein